MTAEAERFFDAIAARYDREYAVAGSASRDRMARVLGELSRAEALQAAATDPAAPRRVLDLGVGTGRELPALLDAGYAPTGVDLAQAMLDRCALRARPIPLVKADFWGPLPLPDASFEAAVALHGTLSHPPELASYARLGEELARLVVPGGVLVAEVPTPAWLDRITDATVRGGRVMQRTGPLTALFEDTVASASIHARILTEAEWRDAFGPAWSTTVSPLEDLEWLVVARRAR